MIYVLLGAGARLTALEGTSLPLAILAVSGWQRLGLHAAASGLAIVLLLLPGAAYAGATFHDYVNDDYAPFTLWRPAMSCSTAASVRTPRAH